MCVSVVLQLEMQNQICQTTVATTQQLEQHNEQQQQQQQLVLALRACYVSFHFATVKCVCTQLHDRVATTNVAVAVVVAVTVANRVLPANAKN